MRMVHLENKFDSWTDFEVKHFHDGAMELMACFGHAGHEINSATTPLSNDDEIVISMITAGIPYQTIVNKLRATRWIASEAPETQPRICFFTMRDVYLIDGRSSEDDRASLKALVEDRENIAAVRLMELKILVLERYGHRGLVFDDTFNVTRYSFRLVTLVDDGGNGFPYAHLLSFCTSTAEVKILFALVKMCALFRSTICNDGRYLRFLQRFQGGISIQQSGEGVVLTRVSTGNTKKRFAYSFGYKLVKFLSFETDSVKFESNFAACMTWLNSVGEMEMLSVGFIHMCPLLMFQHIERNYSAKRRQRALCYRQNAPFTTSNPAESWHKKLKHILLRNNQNGRLDTMTYAFLKHQHDRDLQLISGMFEAPTSQVGVRRTYVGTKTLYHTMRN